MNKSISKFVKTVPYSIWMIISVGLILRLGFVDGPSLWMDEGYSINAVQAILDKGYPLLDSGRWYLGGLLHNYILAFFVGIFGLNNWSVRLPSVIFGALFLLVFYKLLKKQFDSTVAWWGVLFATLSYWQIAWSRQARMYELVLLFLWLSIYYFWLFIQEKQLLLNKNFWLSLLFFVLSAINHPVALLALPAYGLIFIYQSWQNKQLKLLYILTAIFFITQIISYFTPWQYLNFFVLIQKNLVWNFYLPSFAEFLLSSWLVFLVLGLVSYLLFAKNRQYGLKFYFYLFLIVIPFVIYSFFFKTLIFRYLYVFTPVFYIYSAVLLSEIGKLNSKYWKYGLSVSIILALFLTRELILWPTSFYPLESNPEWSTKTYLSYTPQPDFAGGYNFIKQNSQSDAVIISAYPHLTKIYLDQPGFWLKFDYVGADKADYYIGKNNKDYYVNAEVVNNLEELKKITSTSEVYILYDKMAQDRLDKNILDYIQSNFQLKFYQKTNRYSEIFVYSDQ